MRAEEVNQKVAEEKISSLTECKQFVQKKLLFRFQNLNVSLAKSIISINNLSFFPTPILHCPSPFVIVS